MKTKTIRTHVLPSTKNSLLPEALAIVKLFQADSLHALETQINNWANATGNLIVTPGPVSQLDGGFCVVVTYILSAEDLKHERAQKQDAGGVGQTSGGAHKPRQREAVWLSDGKRRNS